MNYIVFDLEWNQSNTGKDEEVKTVPFEIIEIGALKLNNDFEITGEFNRLIKPQIYHEMHHITKKLIHLRMEELDNERFFNEVVQDFLTWCGTDYMFCTWGPLDLTELQRNMRHYHMPLLSDRPLKFYDVQKLFSICFEDKKSRRTLEYAIDFLNIRKDIPFHRAFSDAYYTAKILAHIDKELLGNVSFDVFVAPRNKKEEVYAVFDNYTKYISREFDSKQDVLDDREIMSTKCYLCRKNIKRKIKWFTPNGKHYYSVGYCNNHGFMKAKVRIKKSENDKVYAIKTTKFISEEDVLEIRERQGRARQQKKERNKYGR
ncbi:DNA polymerase III epsilon subunit-like protein [Kineothrix alysoides]|uniref:DNA polymerase III epsilon subunit-like protein n=1 Tax=Kineothrix alysoides TaxID=1469948 RepID=A0A4R1QXY8_9FIRM|nr:3'-5' exonuclease [Kineothrix alysoides]TCL57294.1 DNA polymerase III epsilon subunit-like protein [Kineothrix alysoides]